MSKILLIIGLIVSLLLFGVVSPILGFMSSYVLDSSLEAPEKIIFLLSPVVIFFLVLYYFYRNWKQDSYNQYVSRGY